MRYKTIGDVIDEGRRFHADLAHQYEELEQLTTSERNALLLDQLRRREESMTHSLDNFRQDMSPGVLRSWLQFAPEGKEPFLLDKVRSADIESTESIANAAMDVEIYLADQYRQMLQEAATPSVREALQRLLDLEELEEHTLALNINSLNDY
ncbi:hypothetical protein [Biformimicrobium ophioploci]|uniref:DUF2383 domain-containing protein n=1 Tax=Biformimicrobium ophioploci TaxID=3036711 RepID=A0ABQ6M346_9GAMM|nr:hypothetical protein [Microbulbifer sp. NKW57]GMG88722.1 hypothetical protein MNKW57_30430 [Microbulbifer sp. NKW57]